MRKTAISLGSALVMCLVTAMPALADSSIPEPNSGPQVLGSGGSAGVGGTAFTGSDMSLLLVVLTILVVVGASLLALRTLRTADA